LKPQYLRLIHLITVVPFGPQPPCARVQAGRQYHHLPNTGDAALEEELIEYAVRTAMKSIITCIEPIGSGSMSDQSAYFVGFAKFSTCLPPAASRNARAMDPG